MKKNFLIGRPARVVPRSDGFIELREPGTNWLLALLDPAHNRLQIQRRGVRSIVDLTTIPPVDNDNQT